MMPAKNSKNNRTLNDHSFHKLRNFLRKKKTPIKLLRHDNSPLNTNEIKQFFSDSTSFEKNFSPLKNFSKSTYGKLKAINSKNKTYTKVMSTSQFVMWREMSPGSEIDSPNRIKFRSKFSYEKAKEVKKKLDFETTGNAEDFTFIVSLAEIRKKAPRPVSQTHLMEKISASTYLSIFGAELIQQTQKKIKFHWAHRQAWSLFGEQSKKNLDAATAGSNYDTLFKVETPLKVLLESHLTDKIIVSGTVHFMNPIQRVAKSVVYHLQWNKDKECTIEIDPMSIRYPTQDEADAAIYMMEIETKLSF